MAFFSYLNEKSDLIDILMRDVSRFKPLSIFIESTLRGKSDLSKTNREVMSVYVSALNSCTFCHNAHLEVAKAYGADEHLIDALIKDIDTAPIEDKIKPIYHYIKKLTLSPGKMVSSDAEKVFAVGWSEQALTDAIFVCGLMGLANRIVDGHGIKGTASNHKKKVDLLKYGGYKINWPKKIMYKLYKAGWVKI